MMTGFISAQIHTYQKISIGNNNWLIHKNCVIILLNTKNLHTENKKIKILPLQVFNLWYKLKQINNITTKMLYMDSRNRNYDNKSTIHGENDVLFKLSITSKKKLEVKW